MPHRRSRRAMARRSLRYRVIGEVRRSSLYDRDTCERILLKPVAFFDRGEVLYGVRYVNPLFARLIGGDLEDAV